MDEERIKSQSSEKKKRLTKSKLLLRIAFVLLIGSIFFLYWQLFAGGDIRKAIELGKINQVKNLLIFIDINSKVGRDRDNFKATPLAWAVIHKRKDMVEFLINKGADMTIRDSEGKTPFYHTVMYLPTIEFGFQRGVIQSHETTADEITKIQQDIMKILLSKGAKIDESNGDGSTALHYACINSSSDTVEFLVNSGANINIQDREGKTPLYLVVERDCLEILKLLLRHKARTDVRTRNELTPLHYAALLNRCEVAQLLIENGADVNVVVPGYTQSTPLAMALKKGHNEVAELLRKHGAK